MQKHVAPGCTSRSVTAPWRWGIAVGGHVPRRDGNARVGDLVFHGQGRPGSRQALAAKLARDPSWPH
jgi:hypothetical protein